MFKIQVTKLILLFAIHWEIAMFAIEAGFVHVVVIPQLAFLVGAVLYLVGLWEVKRKNK